MKDYDEPLSLCKPKKDTYIGVKRLSLILSSRRKRSILVTRTTSERFGVVTKVHTREGQTHDHSMKTPRLNGLINPNTIKVFLTSCTSLKEGLSEGNGSFLSKKTLTLTLGMVSPETLKRHTVAPALTLVG